MKQPTPIQLLYIGIIEGFWHKHGNGPTQREISLLAGRNASSVAYMLGRLEDGGFIHPLEGKSRSIRTTRMEHSITIHNWPGEAG